MTFKAICRCVQHLAITTTGGASGTLTIGPSPKNIDKNRELPKTAAQINWQDFHAWKKTIRK